MSKRISDATIRRVLDTAEQMHYSPNELARGLRTGITKTIGVIVADISNQFFGELIYHIQQRALDLDYSVVVTNSNEDPEELLKDINLLVKRQVDGIIMVPTNNSRIIIDRIMALSIPFVQVDRFLEGVDASYVIMNNFKASSALTERLIEEGNRRIAIFTHKGSALNGRLEGYLDTMKRRGLYDCTLVKEIDYYHETSEVERSVRELCDASGKVDAFIFNSHKLFLQGIRYLREAGTDLKDKLRIASFDKVDAFGLVDFPMVYVEQPISAMGHGAVDILIRHINGSSVREELVLDGTINEL